MSKTRKLNLVFKSRFYENKYDIFIQHVYVYTCFRFDSLFLLTEVNLALQSRIFYNRFFSSTSHISVYFFNLVSIEIDSSHNPITNNHHYTRIQININWLDPSTRRDNYRQLEIHIWITRSVIN